MEHQLNDKQHEEIWYTLSDAFVDNEDSIILKKD